MQQSRLLAPSPPPIIDFLITHVDGHAIEPALREKIERAMAISSDVRAAHYKMLAHALENPGTRERLGKLLYLYAGDAPNGVANEQRLRFLGMLSTLFFDSALKGQDKSQGTIDGRAHYVHSLIRLLPSAQQAHILAALPDAVDDFCKTMAKDNGHPHAIEHDVTGCIIRLLAIIKVDAHSVSTLSGMLPSDHETLFRLQAFALAHQGDPFSEAALRQLHVHVPIHPALLDHDKKLHDRLVTSLHADNRRRANMRYINENWAGFDDATREEIVRRHIRWLLSHMREPNATIVFTDEPYACGSYFYDRQAASQSSQNVETIKISRGALKDFFTAYMVVHHEVMGHGGQIDFELTHTKNDAMRLPLTLLKYGIDRYKSSEDNYPFYFAQHYESQVTLGTVYGFSLLVETGAFTPQELMAVLAHQLQDYLDGDEVRKVFGKPFCDRQISELEEVKRLARGEKPPIRPDEIVTTVRRVCDRLMEKLCPDKETGARKVFLFGRDTRMLAAYLEGHIGNKMPPRRFIETYQKHLLAGLDR